MTSYWRRQLANHTRIVVVALAALAVVFTCGCSGGANTSNGNQAAGQPGATTKGAWTLEVNTDEFGDATSDEYTHITTEFTGTFSNTATTGSDFTGKMTIFWNIDEKYQDGGLYLIGFDMVEYGNTPFTYLDSDNSLENTLSTKDSSGNKNSYTVWGTAPDGAITLTDGGLGGGDFIKSLINEKGEMRCILTFGNTTFDFNLDGNGFAEAFATFDGNIAEAMDYMKAKAEQEAAEAEAAEAAKIDAAKSHSDAEAMENIKLYEDPDKKNHYAALYFFEHVGEYAALSQSEIEALFPGTYAWEQIFEGSATGPYIYTYDADGTYNGVAYQTGVNTFESVNPKKTPDGYAIEGDKLVLKTNWSSSKNSYLTTHSYELRKVADGFYLAIEDGSESEMHVMRAVDIESLGI